jgi:hypothetical protein
MSDETVASEPKRPRTPKPEVIEDAVVIEEPAVTAAPVEATKVEPVVIDAPAPQVVYVQAPVPPKKKGNRGIGSVLAIASGLIYTAVFAAVVAGIAAVQGLGQFTLAVITQPTFYVPVLFYVIGAVLLVLIVNRAGWAAYVIGSIFVGLLVYFGTVGMLLLGQGIILMTPTEAAQLFNEGLRNPLIIAAALVGREVSMWTGALISRRGRRLKVRNAEAHEAWQREVADKKAEHERSAPAAATAV